MIKLSYKSKVLRESLMDLRINTNLFQKEWKDIESEVTQPRFAREVISTPYKEFCEKVLEQNPKFVRTIVNSLYSGDIHILKNAFSVEFIKNLVTSTHLQGKSTPSSFPQMLDECPDFHRIITPEISENNSVQQVKHAYFLFPWNKDPLFEKIYERWRVFKFLGGFPMDSYEENIPSTGPIDRIQLAHYVSGEGELEVHSDPTINQKMTISVIMSKRGEDFVNGGSYALNKNKERIDLENNLDIGDIYMFYPTVLHGVETIDREDEVDWGSHKGRWFMGLYTSTSDSYAKQHAYYGVETEYRPL
jgi:hypothetical protein